MVRLELFGSRAKGLSRADSEVDLLVSFTAGFTPGLEFFALADELERLYGWHVDLLTRARVERDENPLFKRSVLGAAEAVYAA